MPSLLRPVRLLAVVTLGAALACASAPAGQSPGSPSASAQPARPAAPDLSGTWAYTVDLQGQRYGGSMVLTRSATGYDAKITEASMGELPVTSLVVEGGTLTAAVNAGGSAATIVATLQADGTMAGTVDAGGTQGSFHARRT